uniref:Uncharacterized protein n=1 Tax=Chromera velia CCMP2878 TaxID=1169474 RepID=A0A0G4F567_9ALVE|mmetsp:Transcript_28463/g.55737  ORF Transcript_28463/g.55737 Transcript_28463/m.55737 type:complete len:168 (-) Transcript_28463:1030-1533(-)|eukprot:Cvel_15148.t1-p1 / transcript=Cvel_15148.t1 / gene=Cvel_15148 / organism=Chromera_velia_CCMP2878 / gene_product=Ankyrin repeat, PH and SEC7 domain containing, putative / transcript_product=Ankyrin repeat, PH and SEC7 domain containing, putative / location=Cvel_scaffold1106:9228-9728(+) / protein_length=167 / sequence_SO=supercontig / SO=protein_coding / is_pseudo=false
MPVKPLAGSKRKSSRVKKGKPPEDKTKDLTLLLRVGADVHGLHEGKNAFCRTVCAGSVETAEKLWKNAKGEGLERRSTEEGCEGSTALHYACYHQQPDMVRFLVKYAAKVDAKDEQGRTPLFRAVFKGNKEIASILLQKKAKLNSKDVHGQALMHECTKQQEGTRQR